MYSAVTGVTGEALDDSPAILYGDFCQSLHGAYGETLIHVHVYLQYKLNVALQICVALSEWSLKYKFGILVLIECYYYFV